MRERSSHRVFFPSFSSSVAPVGWYHKTGGGVVRLVRGVRRVGRRCGGRSRWQTGRSRGGEVVEGRRGRGCVQRDVGGGRGGRQRGCGGRRRCRVAAAASVGRCGRGRGCSS